MFDIDKISIIHGDCMDYMRSLPDRAFDLAIVDPPYYSGPECRSYYGNKSSKVGVLSQYFQSKKWDVPTAEYFDELKRVARFYIVWGCNYYDYIFSHGRIVWDKCNSLFLSDCEIAATNLINSVKLFPFMWNGMMQGKSVLEGRTQQGNKRLNEKRIHPTQKPVALYKWLLNTYAKAGYKILDTHLGSGSSAIAAYELGYEFVGIEINEDYYNATVKRVKDATAQLSLNLMWRNDYDTTTVRAGS